MKHHLSFLRGEGEPLPALADPPSEAPPDSGLPSGGPPADSSVNRYTLGDLIRDLEGGERAAEESNRTANRIEVEQGPLLAYNFRVQAAAANAPNWAGVPGIDRLVVLCDERFGGTGLTASNVRRVRACYCRLSQCTPPEADDAVLAEVAEALDSARPDAAASPAHAQHSCDASAPALKIHQRHLARRPPRSKAQPLAFGPRDG